MSFPSGHVVVRKQVFEQSPSSNMCRAVLRPPFGSFLAFVVVGVVVVGGVTVTIPVKLITNRL